MNVMLPLLVLAACLVGCRHVERTPFDDVVDYYAERMESATATEADTLKFKAAEYLREHSDCHYGVPRHLADSLGRRTELDHKAFSSDTLYRRFLDSNGYRYMNEAAVYDSDTITTDFLIENIELAHGASPGLRMYRSMISAVTFFPTGLATRNSPDGAGSSRTSTSIQSPTRLRIQAPSVKWRSTSCAG